MKFFRRIPLVLLPGTACNRLLWRQLLPILPKQIQPVMPDLLPCTSQQAMLDVIHQLPYDKFMLMGFSMGGYLAQQFYATHPERVSHLILLCTSGEKKQTPASVIERNLKRVKDEAYLSHLINPKSSEHQQELVAKITTMLDQVGPEAASRQMYATAHRHACLNQFPEKPVPTLVVGAGQDKVIAEQHIRKLAEALNTDVTWVDKSGHMLPLESPDELGCLIKDWFNQQNMMFEVKCESDPVSVLTP
ncbi:MAG: alpha/beta hydrolase [Legionellaceae bacterium]|nr:alpha/beta hydrolase [Legionellaceae bacterium]